MNYLPELQAQGEPDKKFGNALDSIAERFTVAMRERDTAVSQIRACPAACSDGRIAIDSPSGGSMRITCHLASPDCAYGVQTISELEGRIETNMKNIGVPLRHITNFARFRETMATKKVAEWEVRGVLLLCGKPSAGKSFGAAWTVKQHLKAKIADRLDRSKWSEAERAASRIVWFRAMDLTLEKEMTNKAISAALLVIDGLGDEEDARGGIATTRHILAKRYDSALPTLITTELAVSDIAQMYGKQTAAMLAEEFACGGKLVDCGNAVVADIA